MEATEKSTIIEFDLSEGKFNCTSSISAAIIDANNELQAIEETIKSVESLKPDCDKIDYVLAASSGAICGIIDVFLVGKPGESPIGKITDSWFTERTKDFAKLCGWKGGNDKSAIGFLERKFRVPYDQRGAGDAASFIFDLNPRNHHFKSLGHNPTLLGLFFSILDQFTNQSHFISDGQLIALEDADDGFELKGGNIPSKLFCGFVNWFGHLMSDVSGASGSKGRGAGIPSPLWTWMNDIMAIKASLKIPASEFDKSVNDLALELFKKGFDARFQTAQAIPVFLNGLIVRLFYMIRRMISYYKTTEPDTRSFKLLWSRCNPFNNASIHRMLAVAHGVFCIVDVGDATIRGFIGGGGSFNPVEFFLRLNIAGLGRFTFALFDVAKDVKRYNRAKDEAEFAAREKIIVENYLEGLAVLSEIYDDENLVNFVDDLKASDLFVQAFDKSYELAVKRGVSNPLKTKSDIDNYFLN